MTLAETTACDLDLIESLTRHELFNDYAVQSRLPHVAERRKEALQAVEMAARQHTNQGPADHNRTQAWARTMN